jgi:hypothetical protein
VCRFKLRSFVIILYCAPQWLVTFARCLRSSFGVGHPPAYAPRSCCSHQQFSPLMSPFLFTWFASPCGGGCEKQRVFYRAVIRAAQTIHSAQGDSHQAPQRGRNPAKYCASNARRAAVTVGPIPTMPSSTLWPRSAIQSSPRINKRG